MRNESKNKNKHSSVKNWKHWVAGWFPAVLGLVLSILGTFNPAVEIPCLIIISLAGYIAISVILHECGHFFVGRTLGMKSRGVSIGYGTIIFDKQFSRFRLIMRAFPYSGAVYPFVLDHEGNRIRWKEFIMIAAGPAANMVLLYFSTLIVFSEVDTPNWNLERVGLPLLLANAYLLIFSLFPYSAIVDGVRTPNDGLQMFYLLIGRWLPKRKSQLAESPTRSQFPGPSWKWIVKVIQEPHLILVAHRKELSNPALSIEKRILFLDAFATYVLMYGLSEFLVEADRYSEELLRLQPQQWTVKGTRGSILIEMGQLDTGTAMLTEVMENDPSDFDRAIAASFLALAEIRNYNREVGLKWLNTVRKLDPNCGALQRVQSALDAAVPQASTVIKNF